MLLSSISKYNIILLYIFIIEYIMGACQGNKAIAVEANCPKAAKSSSHHRKQISEESIEAKDMKEWEGERYTGIGIKRMKGYKCELPIDKLNERRNAFWKAKNNRNNPRYKVWRVINQACVYDECIVLINQYRSLKFTSTRVSFKNGRRMH